MSYTLDFSGKFSKDAKLCKKRSYDISLIETVFEILENYGEVPSTYKPHKLFGNYANHWECHIKPDWLLIWTIDEEEKVIHLVRTGTHSDLFG